MNLRLALVLLAVSTVMVLGGWLLRRNSLSRNADAFLRFAQSQRAAGNTKAALENVLRFLAMVPNDPEGINLFAELTDGENLGETELLTTYQVFSDFVVRNPDRLDLRKRLFEMAYQIPRFGEMVDIHLPRLRELVLENRDYTNMAVDGFLSLSRVEEGLQLVLESIDRQPQKVSRYEDLIQLLGDQELNSVDLASLYARFAPEVPGSIPTRDGESGEDPLIDQRLRNLGKEDEAGKGILDELGDAPGSDVEPEVRAPDGVLEELASGRAQTLSVPMLVDLILAEALKKGRPPVDARVLRAKIQIGRGNLDQALAELDEAEKLDPRDPEYIAQRLQYLSQQRNLALGSGDAQEVAQTVTRILSLEKTIDDNRKGTWLSRLILGQILQDIGDLSKSESQFRRAFELGQNEKQQYQKSVIGRRESLRIDFLTHWGLINSLIESANSGNSQASDEEGRKLQKLRTEIADLIGEVRKMDALPSLIEFLEVQSLLVDRKWAEAAARFEAIRVGLSDMPDIVRLLDRSLVECYQRLRNPDETIRAIQRALASDPYWIQGRLGLADAYLQAGREDLAMEEFAKVSQVSAVPSVVMRLAIRREMGKTEGQRDWSAIQQTLDTELARNPHDPELLSIQSDVLRFQNRLSEGLALVRAAREAQPDNDALVALEVNQMLLADPGELAGNLTRAEELLASIGRDSALLRLSKARLEGERKAADLGARLLGLSENCEVLPVSEQLQLQEGLASVAVQYGLNSEAVKLMDRALLLDPDNLELMAARVTMLMQAGAPSAEIESTLSRVRDLDLDPKPNYHYLVGLRELRDYRVLGDSDVESVRVARLQLLRSAEQNLSIAVKGRPSWVAARSQYTQVLFELGDEEAGFRKARELLSEGLATPEAVTGVMQYLFKNQRFEELLEVVRELDQKQPDLVSEDVARAGMLASYRSRRWEETIQLMGRLNSSTVEDLLIQAQLLIARRGDPQRTEEVLSEALKLAPNQRLAWFLWMSFLIREQRLPEARSVLERIRTEVPESPPNLRPWTLAQCEELLGELDQADQHYSEAHRDDVSNLQIINEHIGFRVRNNRQQGAQALLKLVADPASGLDAEIRNQADILRHKLRGMTAKSYAEFEEALASLQANVDLSRVSESQLRAQLVLYASVGRSREQLRMISILEELGARKVLSGPESLELAWLYSRNWRWADAVVLYRRILENEPDNIQAHASLVEAAVRRPQLDERTVQDVAKSVSQLVLRAPESLRTLACQVQWLDHQGKSEESESLIRQFLKRADQARPREQFRQILETDRASRVLQKLRDDVVEVNDLNAMAVVEAVENRSISGNDPQVMSILAKYIEAPDFAQLLRQQMLYRAAQLAEISRQFALSDELYGSVQRDGRTRDGDTEYLAYLSRRARFDEALELWERIQSELSTNLKARSLAAIARAGKAPSEVCAKVELLIREVMTRIPEQETDEQVGALLALADVYDLQERFAEARSVYGQILASDPRNIVALNNMSQLACHADKPAERQRSVELIDQAIEIAGPLPALLDSRAIVKLNLEQLDSAVQDLRQALDQDSNPMFWLHLAYVQIRRNDLRGASEAFERASDPQIEKDKLHPLERPLFEELQQRLAPPGT